MSKVLVMDSTYKTCSEAVDRAFAAFPLDLKGKRVVVKMNALKPGDPDCYPYTTNYHLLKAVIRKVETLDPAALSPKDRAKLSWKQRMLDDPDARLAWLQKRAKSGKHAYVMHLKLFGCKMPGGWFRVFSKKAGNAT